MGYICYDAGMDQGLHDFRIENDSVVLLSFADGTRQRVAPKDLDCYLTADEVNKVQAAMRLRKQFMRRVLPPTAMIILLGSIAGLGVYDVTRLAQPASEANTPAVTGEAPGWLPSLAPVQSSPPRATMPIKPVSDSRATTKPVSAVPPALPTSGPNSSADTTHSKEQSAAPTQLKTVKSVVDAVLDQ